MTAPVRRLLLEAQALVEAGKGAEAVSKASEAIMAQPNHPQAWFIRGRIHERLSDSTHSIEDYTRVLELDPGAADVLQFRGAERLRSNDIAGALQDFDRYLAMRPEQASQHWQRGIALYYAGRYDDGRRQFERHRTVNPEDAENSMWHFLCVAKLDGITAARTRLLPVSADSRLPMLALMRLYGGLGSEAQVLQNAESGDPDPARRNTQRFNAHYYLALYWEALGEGQRAADHLQEALKIPGQQGFMGELARLHAKRRKSESNPTPAKP